MKKVIKITEQQLDVVIKRVIEEQEFSSEKDYPVFIQHWENKFMRSIEILIKIGRSPEYLINKIQEVYEKSNKINREEA